MTKDWNNVRGEIVQLISNGASLEQVRALLSKERGFQASIRSYRKRLKQWKLTRAGQFELLKTSAAGASDATGSIPSIAFPADSDMATTNYTPSELEETTPSRTDSTAGLSVVSDQHYPSPMSNAHALSPRTGHPSPTMRATLHPLDARSLASPQLENTFRALETAENGPTMFGILERIQMQFQPGTKSILHFAASKKNFWVLDCILDFMLSRQLDVDITSDDGMTALEVAIRNARRENVQSLLRACADVRRRSPRFGQPLHLAASLTTSADICRVLLFHGADVNAPKQEEGPEHKLTPLRIAIGQALDLDMGQDKDRVSAMIEVLLEHGGRLSGGDNAYDHDTDILNFLDRWTRWKIPREGDSSNRGFYLGHYFRADCSPLCWFPARHCAECHSMASYIFSHTKEKLAYLLIKSSDMDRYGAQLAKRILVPCTKRSVNEADYLSGLLRALLQKSNLGGQASSWDANLVHQVLEESPDSEKASLLNTLIDSHVVMNRQRERTFTALVSLENGLRLQLAEICLDPAVGIISKEMYENMMQMYLKLCDTWLEPGHLLREMHSYFLDEMIRELQINEAGIRREQSEALLRCIVHVLTRFLLTDTSAAISERERIEAFRLRDIFLLSELAVSSKFLIGLWPFDENIAPLWKREQDDHIRTRDHSITYPESFSTAPRTVAWEETDTRSISMRDSGQDLPTDEPHASNA